MRPGSGWMVGVGGLITLALLAAGPARAEEAERPFALTFDLGPAFYEYTERGTGPFGGLETEWKEIGVLLRAEAAWETPVRGWMEEAAPKLGAFLRFRFLTTAEDTETNNVGATTTELRVAYLFSLLPGVRFPFRWFPGVTVTPELMWDLDWYLQERETNGGGRVDESVFRHGPSPGARLAWEPDPDWSVELAYRHAFLIHVGVSNTFAESFGIDDLETDGHRDVVEIGLSRRLGERWSVGVGYRFEIARIDASRTAERIIEGAAGRQRIEVQFPENEHRLHAALLSATFRF